MKDGEMSKLLLVLLVLLLPSAVHAQAFGVKMGSSVAQYKGHPALGVNNPYYFTITVPVPNGEFESYSALSTPETGICKVTAFGVTHRNDAYGTRTRAAFSGLQQALRARYGASSDFDFLKSGALWKAPREWVWSIYKEERTLASFWVPSANSSLPAGIHGIALQVKAISSSEPYVTLGYEFANFGRCLSLIGQRNAQGL